MDKPSLLYTPTADAIIYLIDHLVVIYFVVYVMIVLWSYLRIYAVVVIIAQIVFRIWLTNGFIKIAVAQQRKAMWIH